MERSIQGGRWAATFRPGRRVRFFATAILVPWLVLWVLGEALAAAILLASLDLPGGTALLGLFGEFARTAAPDLVARYAWREIPGPGSASPLALSFIGAWLAIWTLAGIVALQQIVRLHASEDRLEWDGAGIEVLHRTGPFRSRRSWRADQIEHLSLSRADRALLVHTRRATHALTPWGTKRQRAAVCDEIRRALRSPGRALAKPAGAEPPRGWVSSPAGEGGTRLRRDLGRRAPLAWFATGTLAAAAAIAWSNGSLDVAWLPVAGGGAVAAAAAVALATAASARYSFGGTEVVFRKGEIEFRRGPLAWGARETLKPFRLYVGHTTDDDGDDWFELQARSGDRHRAIEREMNDSETVLLLARWLADRSGADLDIGRGVVEGEGEERPLAA